MTDGKDEGNPPGSTGRRSAGEQALLGFARTVERLVDLAIARHEVSETEAARARQPAGPQESFAFLPLAAATGGPPLPSQDDELLDESQSLGFWVESLEPEALRLHFQAKGFTTIDSLAERWATVSSKDLLINLSLKFDPDGHAHCDLPDLPEFRSALAAPLDVTVPGLHFDFGSGSGRDDRPR
ncbi:hypothetical protein J2847_003329 [Azospirillum agricola]|uniref:hypothetical protein n=1 Tax=Azospirillum agricola TaxID=1720247 RepID=UPI001AEB7A75|nr:hypothetical protein [Azospirillum agricola]MBP2230026.1 hypothetical protein [Azospirillum agricola]